MSDRAPTGRPIIMSAPMVRAILREIERPGEGKTQIRRHAWSDPPIFNGDVPTPQGCQPVGATFGSTAIPMHRKPSPWQKVRVGERIWVRESFTVFDREELLPGGKFFRRVPTPMYAADYMGFDKPDRDWDWTSSLRMPRWASRLTLHVTAVKLERLQDVTEGDARAGVNILCAILSVLDDDKTPPLAEIVEMMVSEFQHGAQRVAEQTEINAALARLERADG